jgi:uncharacterized membrane protein
MVYLYSGIILFFGVHLIPAFSGVKRGLQTRLGMRGYRALFALVALLGLGLMIWGRVVSGHDAVYEPPAWGKPVTFMLVLFAFILLASANMKGRIRKIVRHPMLLGVLLWSVGHLLVNGDRASLWLFGSFALFSLVAIFSPNLRGAPAAFEVKSAHDIRAFVGGIVLYGVFVAFLHGWLMGVSPI